MVFPSPPMQPINTSGRFRWTAKNLDAANYTVKEGSTIVTLKAEYLETLSVGKHTLAIVSDTGTAAAEFTIQAAPVTDNTRYYTCQSCGHHDWTATDAGYRCDYCGRVVSEQISGYPNVKGGLHCPHRHPRSFHRTGLPRHRRREQSGSVGGCAGCRFGCTGRELPDSAQKRTITPKSAATHPDCGG